MSEILVGDHVYLNFPGMKEETGKSWVDYPLDDLSTTDGIDPKTVAGQGHQGDPALHSKLLTASKDVHTVGTDLVGGVSTTHYQGTFALKDALTGKASSPPIFDVLAVLGREEALLRLGAWAA